MNAKKIENDLTPQGILALAQEPIKATLSFLDFPHLRIEQVRLNDGSLAFIGVLSLELDDHINIEMAGAVAFREALAIVAFHQQMTTAPLLINDDFVEYATKLPPTNPIIDRNGNPITKAMMTKEYRQEIDFQFAEKRMEQEKTMEASNE
ncbi:hypothetical protein NYR75_02445 [Actinobacillus equuli subsp. haemolyticus]|uniref:hypothetical protein n=1 Tax=Actinobacillus equuli TaxID=718 RepID=UPI0024429E67|nr:hypothetical protein [Actinobacillus equuli]WGE63703.1 hypothetical protein NYR75_02445 [Actinobacillus equuli subsp. haemolyticus]